VIRVVFDLQALQDDWSGTAGVGAVIGDLAVFLARDPGLELHVVLSDRWPERTLRLRARLRDSLPQERIHVASLPTDLLRQPPDDERAELADLVWLQFVLGFQPDVVLMAGASRAASGGTVTGLSQLARLPASIVVIDDLVHMAGASTSDAARRDWARAQLVKARAATKAVCLTEAAGRLMAEVDRELAGVVSVLGVDLDNDGIGGLSPEPGSRDPLTTGSRCPVLVELGGGSRPQKMLQATLAGIAALPTDLYASYEFVVIGRAEDDTWLMEQLRQVDSAEGAVVNPIVEPDSVKRSELLRQAVAVVFPLDEPGFGLRKTEALRLGTRPIGVPPGLEASGVGGGGDERAVGQRWAAAVEQGLQLPRLESQERQRDQCGGLWEVATSALSSIVVDVARTKTPTKARSARPIGAKRPRLALVSPFPPDPTGIADCVSELVPALAKHYTIDVIRPGGDKQVQVARGVEAFRDPATFQRQADAYDRVVYQIGNSGSHCYQVELLKRVPGLAVLHEVDLKGLWWAYCDSGRNKTEFERRIYRSDGYPGLSSWRRMPDPIREPRMSLEIIDAAVSVIVQSKMAVQLAERAYGKGATEGWVVVPLPRMIPANVSQRRGEARRRLGLGGHELLIASFGHVGSTKRTGTFIRALEQLPRALQASTLVTIVGGVANSGEGQRLSRAVADAVSRGWRIELVGYAPRELYETYLAACDIAVQLRAESIGEVSATVLDAMAWGKAVLVNEIGWTAELPRAAAALVGSSADVEEVAATLKKLLVDEQLRASLGQQGQALVREAHDPGRVAEAYRGAIEATWEGQVDCKSASTIRSIGSRAGSAGLSLSERVAIAQSLAANEAVLQNRLLVDVSVCAQADYGTGAQRVVRALTTELIRAHHQWPEWRVEPVVERERRLRRAQRFTAKLLEIEGDWAADPLDGPRRGDVYFGLDTSDQSLLRLAENYQMWRAGGTTVTFLVHDMLPIQMPQCFPPQTVPPFRSWLRKVVTVGDHVICVSRAVAEELLRWMEQNSIHRDTELSVGVNHSGADFDRYPPAAGSGHQTWGTSPVDLPRAAAPDVEDLAGAPLVLMVGTVEPRKGHSEALDAMDALWSRGEIANLGIVGQRGWMVDGLVERIVHHPMLGRQLFWWQGIEDVSLIRLYETAAVLLMASHGEGFGLPLVEAARFGTPVVARDLPVFREVAGEGAIFFGGPVGPGLTESLEMALAKDGGETRTVRRRGTYLTWAQAARNLMAMLADPDHPNWIACWDGKRTRHRGDAWEDNP